MQGEIRRLGKETLVYGLSTIVGRFLNFLLLPFYTHFLATSEYGIVAVIFTYLAFLNILYQYGMDQAYLRYASSLEIGDLKDNFSTAMASVLVSSFILSGILFTFSGTITSLIGIPARFSELPKICAGILALDALAIVPFAELRRAHRPWLFTAIKISNIAVNVGLNVLFLWRLNWGVRGVFLASLIASASSLLLLAPTLFSLWRPRFHSGLFPALVRFAAPYIPSGLASMAVQVIDRPILKAFTDDSTVGIYQANYRLGIFMMLVVNMFDAAWRPFFLDQAGKPNAPQIFARVTTYFLLVSSVIVLGLSLFIGDLVRLPIMGHPLIHPAYWSGLPVVPIVLIGYLFNGAYYNFMPQVYLPKRTDLLIWVTLVGAAVNVAANFLLIPSIGMMGAAWATLLAYFAMALALFLVGRRLYPIPYEWRRIALAALLLALVWGAADGCRAIFPQLSPGSWGLVRLAAIVLYPILLFAAGFFDPAELRTLRSAFYIIRS